MPERIKKLQNEIHLWIVLLYGLDDPSHESAILSPDEIERGKGYVFNYDRNRFEAGRSGLRKILSNYTGIPPDRLLFKYNKYGKPAIADPVDFNCSHSEDLMVIACTSGREIGIDIEKIRIIDNIDSLARFVFTTEELSYFQQLHPSSKSTIFFRLWTRKEALLKAAGTGLAENLNKVNVMGAVNGITPLEEKTTLLFNNKLWKIDTIPDLRTGFCGYICYEGEEDVLVKTKYYKHNLNECQELLWR